jgi:hypothetical protein
MQNTEQLDLLINVLTRVKNCDKAVLILKDLLSSIVIGDKEIFYRRSFEERIVINRVHDKILKVLELIEN